MPETLPPVGQLIRNFTVNLPVFPPAEADLIPLHGWMMEFYAGFRPEAEALGIAEEEQARVLERAQKTLWAFGEGGRLEQSGPAPALTLDRLEFLSRLKFPRPEETLALLGRLGMPVEYEAGGAWSSSGRLKASQRLRLRSPLAPALRELVMRSAANSAKPRAAYERFLRANPQAVLALEKPGLNLPPDSPAILANLPGPAALAWQDLVRFLARFEGYTPVVEFRSIQHGLWAVNYASRRGGRDLCGLTVQNGALTVRMILYRAGYGYVRERVEDFGPLVAAEFRRAHFYEEFGHQWLFVPAARAEDTAGIKKLLEVMPALLKEK